MQRGSGHRGLPVVPNRSVRKVGRGYGGEEAGEAPFAKMPFCEGSGNEVPGSLNVEAGFGQ